MKAIVQDRYGSPDVLQLREIDKPVIDDDRVLVRVHAAAVNALDWHLTRGLPRLARPAFGLRRPRVRVRGVDVAGHVEAVGTNVTRFKPGDDVFGTGLGTFAEYAASHPGDGAARPLGTRRAGSRDRANPLPAPGHECVETLDEVLLDARAGPAPDGR